MDSILTRNQFVRMCQALSVAEGALRTIKIAIYGCEGVTEEELNRTELLLKESETQFVSKTIPAPPPSFEDADLRRRRIMKWVRRLNGGTIFSLNDIRRAFPDMAEGRNVAYLCSHLAREGKLMRVAFAHYKLAP